MASTGGGILTQETEVSEAKTFYQY